MMTKFVICMIRKITSRSGDYSYLYIYNNIFFYFMENHK